MLHMQFDHAPPLFICQINIEKGCDAEDIALTVHPHPTLSESVGMAAEVAAGTITDLYLPKKR